MADKFLPCANTYDQVALLAEIIVTLRAGFGMKPAEYSAQQGGLVIPDDYKVRNKAPKVKEDKKEKAEEVKAA